MKIPFHFYSKQEIEKLFFKRPNEIKLGEKVKTINADNYIEEIKTSSAKYILLGIPEDIGVRANYGKPGASEAWDVTINSFLSIQSNSYLNGEEIIALGYFDCSEIQKKSEGKSIEDLREITHQIDESVYQFISEIYSTDKELIIIGGGHNNSYGCLKGVSKAVGSPVNCINIDPHSDFRLKEGRHSGNGFRYAMEEGYLKNYSIFGLHENYSPSNINQEIHSNKSIRAFSFEEIKVRSKYSMIEILDSSCEFIQEELSAIEFDLDGIEYVPTSAMSPCGWSSNEARIIINECASRLNVAYLHLAEGAPNIHGNPNDNIIGKLNAYLISDFIKARNRYHSK